MTGRERILKAIAHEEADRVPIDFGGCSATTINERAYAALLSVMGYDSREIELSNDLSRIALVDSRIIERFSIDTIGVYPKVIHGGFYPYKDGTAVTDEWGIQWFMPCKSGHYYDMISHPLKGSKEEDVARYRWSDGANPERFTDMDRQIEEAVSSQNAVVVGVSVPNGLFQTGNWLEGYEDFLCDLALEPKKAGMIMDKVLEIKYAYWNYILGHWGDKIDIILELDDLGTQSALLISPEIYLQMLKPRQKLLFSAIKKMAPHVKILFHSCGSVKPLIPHLIEAGIDILNPVQISAYGMDPAALKKEFGRDVTFWGGGVDTQNTLCKCTPDEVENEVRKNLEAFAPGGGYVFAQVHNIQEEVPPQNMVRMWETVLKYGKY